jgi:hypothetical protein
MEAGYRWIQGGVGYRGFALLSSSGQTIMRLPSGHWSESSPAWRTCR